MSHTEIIKALLKVQKDFPRIEKNNTNPHFKNRYADLSEIINKTRDVLHLHGLVLMQTIISESTDCLTLRTTLYHESGESISSDFSFHPDINPQKIGSQLTYFRRYSIAALLNIAADDDDDGDSASQKWREEKTNYATEAQKKAICGLIKQLGYGKDYLMQLCKNHGSESIDHVSKSEASKAIKYLQNQIELRKEGETE